MAIQKHRNINSGEKFNQLTVVGLVYHKGCANTYYECVCTCGNKCYISRASLMKGQKSCGCITGCGRSKNRQELSVKDAAFNCIYTRYIQQARLRKLVWSLDISQAFALFNSNCFYCNRPPSNGQLTKQTPTRKSEIVNYNGIDRLNNSQGYTELNCVSCCYVCNKMKMDGDLSDFLANIKNIYENISMQYL